MIEVAAVGAEAAEVVHALTQAAFAGYAALTPPSGAVSETVEDVRAMLAAHGGGVATIGGEPVGCYRLAEQEGMLHARRVAVDPAHQGRGVGRALMRHAEDTARARGRAELRVGVRDQLPANRALYEHLGYAVVADHGFWQELAKPLQGPESDTR